MNEKHELMEYCFRKAIKATDEWIENLSQQKPRPFTDRAYAEMWEMVNNACAISGALLH